MYILYVEDNLYNTLYTPPYNTEAVSGLISDRTLYYLPIMQSTINKSRCLGEMSSSVNNSHWPLHSLTVVLALIGGIWLERVFLFVRSERF